MGAGKGFLAQQTKPHGADILAPKAGTELRRVMPAVDEDPPLLSVLAKTCPFVRADVLLCSGNSSSFPTEHCHTLLRL